MDRKLRKSASDKVLGGVCGGLGEYLNLDPNLIRIGWVLFSALGGSGVFAYILACIIMPEAEN